MVVGSQGYKHDYIILDSEKKLVYKEGDSINLRISYGYKTIFANLFEFGKGKVSKANLDEALCLNIIIAEFAYAILPRFFRHILGVTGTLQAMPRVKKEVLRRKYDVKDLYLMPSSFGKGKDKRIWNYHQVEEEEYYSKIIELIKAVKNNRPTIIFFESAGSLYQFFNRPAFSSDLKERTLVLTEEH